jgi:tripartite-type tricarboxylate transporter receptor subunit TctC
MKIPRRHLLRLAAGAAALCGTPSVARAQAYPSRPIRLVVPFPAGGPVDLFGRLIGQWLSEHLGQPIIIENRAGAGGNIGTESIARAASDGYSLLYISSNNAWNAALYENLNFNFVRDIEPVASTVRIIGALVVHPSFPPRSVPELIAYAKANPGEITMASAGIGTGPHIWGELFKMMAGVDMLHVPYRGGGPALTDLLAGHVSVMFDVLSTSLENIRAGKLRALGVTAATRLDMLPDVPTIGKFVPGYEASGWGGIGVPRNTPVAVIDRLGQEINAGLADPKLKARITDLGATVFASSHAEFARFVVEYTERWVEIIRSTGAKPQ